tara:strand:+ start:3320 stop:4090 length:771 start_codon:yes stop_codon:yes gene_type:complete
MPMVEAVFNTDILRGFVTGFGEGVDDLQCSVNNLMMEGVVDVATHYFGKCIMVKPMSVSTQYKPGKLCIPDVHKLGAFLKSCDEDTTHVRHVNNMLTVTNGNQQFSTPTHDNVLSYQSVDRAKVAISNAVNNKWTKLGRADIQYHATATMGDLHGLSSMTKVVAKDAPIRVKMEGESMTITAGNMRGTRMSRTIDVDELTSNAFAETVFSSQFPKLLSIMPSGEVTLRMGNKNALIISHNELACLLILKHQEGVDA